MKLRDKPRALLALIALAQATSPVDSAASIKLAQARDKFLKDADFSDGEKDLLKLVLAGAENSPVTADATAAVTKAAELEGDEPSVSEPAPLHRGISEEALALAKEELNPQGAGQPVVPVEEAAQPPAEQPQGEGLNNPVLQPDAEVPVPESPTEPADAPARRGPGRPPRNQS